MPRKHEPVVDVGDRGLLGLELQAERLNPPVQLV